MLRSLREGSKTWYMKALLGLLALTFVAFFGVSGNLTSALLGNVNALVEVGSISYGINDVQTQFNQATQREAQRTGSPIFNDPEKLRQVMAQAIAEIVNQALFEEGAGQLGLVVGDDVIADQIISQPAFQAGGQFNRIAFNTYLLQRGMTESQFADSLRGQMIVQDQYVGSLFLGAKAPKPLADALYRYYYENRTAEIVFINAEDQTAPGTPSAGELAQFYSENEEIFRTTPTRLASVLWVTPNGIADDIEISEDQIAAAYEERGHQFTPPERRTLEQAIFPDAETAQAAYEEVAAGTAFADAVRASLGTDPDAIGAVRREELLPEQADPAFAVEVGGITEPFDAGLGWIIVHVLSSEGGETPPLEDVREDLRLSLALEEANLVLFDYADLVDDALAGGATLGEAANQVGLPLLSVGPVAYDGSDGEGNFAENLPFDPKVLAEIYSLADGETGQLVFTDGGGFFFVSVDEAIADRIPDQSEIEDKITAAWVAAQNMTRARAQSEEIAQQLRGGASSDAVSRAFGYEILTPEPFTRSGNAGGLPSGLIEPLFGIAVGEVFTVDLDTAMLVGRLTAIDIAEPNEDLEEWTGLIQQLEFSLAQDLIVQMTEALRADIDVNVESSTIEELFFNR